MELDDFSLLLTIRFIAASVCCDSQIQVSRSDLLTGLARQSCEGNHFTPLSAQKCKFLQALTYNTQYFPTKYPSQLAVDIERLWVVDSHTEGEPTRVVIRGFPELQAKDLPGKARELKDRFDGLRAGIVCEPRGSEAIVGALLCEPDNAQADFGVVFFNNGGCIGMCGHGMIGVAETLRHLGRTTCGEIKVETPVGMVRAILHEDARVSIHNVPSYRFQKDVSLHVPSFGRVTGDIAYGGNWFFITPESPAPLALSNLAELMDFSKSVRYALAQAGIKGEEGAEIDHIELSGPPTRADADGKNFVLCPGLAFDRSPCGTGTSAKMACLAADGKLAPGQIWRQESIIGTLFHGAYTTNGEQINPCITGRAHITGEAVLIFSPDDPLREGLDFGD